MSTDKQTELRPAQQKNDTKLPQRTLTDSDIEELISFFQLVAKRDREYGLKVIQEGRAP